MPPVLPSFLSTIGSLVEDDNRHMVLMYVLTATVVIVIVVALLLFATTRPRLNWYEKNVLDLSRVQPAKYVQRKTFTRCDTEEERESVSGIELARRKQSRILRVRSHDIPPTFLPSDFSDRFTIPRPPKSKQSMFTNPHHSQFDRGLYQCSSTMPDSESNYDEASIGTSGSIQLSIWMDTQLALLTVSLKQAIDVPSKRQDGNPNPYFRVALDVPESTTAKVEQLTTVYKNTLSPTINEEFYFQTPAVAAVAANCRLEVMVYDYDQFSVDECVGYCWITLGRVTISNDRENPTVFWAEVLPFDENGGKGFGEVLISLTYLAKAQRLMMNVFKARNLLVRNPDAGGYFCIRVSLLDNAERRLKRKKTSSRKNAKNAQFNESLNFQLPKNQLCDSILEIEAIHEYGTFGMGCEVLGKMELPLHKCKELWRAIIREERSQARWYPLEEP